MSVGATIRALRTRRGLTRQELARRSGITHQQLYYIERGLRSPSLETLGLIASALRVRPSTILRRAERMKTEA